ncbi:MAG: RICIN domain-containing protein [Streptomyces sp.]|nr:RICIN domain-containing protein [Streptomyces sp.]
MLLAALVPFLGPAGPAAAATSFTSTAIDQASGNCLDDPYSQTASGVQLIQYSCNGGSNQNWSFTPAGTTAGAYTVTSFAGLCLDVAGGSTADNAAVDQATCSGADNQRFTLQPVAVAGASNTFNLVAGHSGKCVAPTGDTTANNTVLVQLPCTTAATRVWRIPSYTAGTGGGTTYQGIPAVAPNSCKNSGLPNAYGTNFPTPADPYGQGFQNQSAIGWEGNYWPAYSYLSGSYFARGVPTTYTSGSTTLCGAMYSFGIYHTGGNRPAQSVQWTEDSGYLPALTTSFTTGSTAVSIKNFTDKVTIAGNPVLLAYTRVSVTDNGTAAVTLDPAGTGPNLVRLTAASLNTVQPQATSNHDYVAAIDTFGSGAALPTTAQITSAAPGLDSAYGDMAAHWNARLAETAAVSLPNTALPNTGGLANPGTALGNAYKAGTIYGLIMQIGKAQFSGANNYFWELNHDVPGELISRFETGDFQDAQNLLLDARVSEAVDYDEKGANWYYDGDWKTPAAWALYLAKTGDTAFVGQYFHDDAGGSSAWGPSLYTIMHTIYQGQLASDGALKASYDNDSSGRWLFDDYSALQGLAAYKYIATRLGNTAEAQYADTAYASLLSHLNTVLGANQSAHGFSYLPCAIDVVNSANRCNTYDDANWASPVWVGQNQWSTMLEGGALTGIAGSAVQSDAMYAWGFARLSANGLPYPTFGAFNGYSTAYNTAYASNGLYGTAYRDLPITSYAWQLATTTGGPNAWWEANGSGPSSANPWIGNHAGPQFGACPYAWPISAQQQGLIESVVAEGRASTGTDPFTFTRPLYIGRGIPDSWIAAGQTTSVTNLTSSYDTATGARSTYGVSLAVTKPGAGRVITVSLTGTLPGGAVSVQLPVFTRVAVNAVTGGSYDAATHTVTADPGATTVTVTLAS